MLLPLSPLITLESLESLESLSPFSLLSPLLPISYFLSIGWSDTTNTASRMESNGWLGYVQVTPATFQLLHNKSQFQKRGTLLLLFSPPPLPLPLHLAPSHHFLFPLCRECEYQRQGKYGHLCFAVIKICKCVLIEIVKVIFIVNIL